MLINECLIKMQNHDNGPEFLNCMINLATAFPKQPFLAQNCDVSVSISVTSQEELFTTNSGRGTNPHGRGLGARASVWSARPLRRCGGFKMAEALTTQEQLVRRSSRFFLNHSCHDRIHSACVSPHFFHGPPRAPRSFCVCVDVPARDV